MYAGWQLGLTNSRRLSAINAADLVIKAWTRQRKFAPILPHFQRASCLFHVKEHCVRRARQSWLAGEAAKQVVQR